MSYQPRIPISFTSVDATTASNGAATWTFPLAEYEWSTSQALRVPLASLTGAQYDYEILAAGPAPRQSAVETLQFLFRETTPQAVDSAIQTALAAIANYGTGKLWAQDADGTTRWAYARAMALPAFRWRAGDIFRKSAQMQFRRGSDWYAATSYSTVFTINADPKTISVVNDGSLRVWNAVLLFKGSFSGLDVTNNSALIAGGTSKYEIGSDRIGAAASDWLKIDAGAYQALFSSDSGVNYAGDYANINLPTLQVAFMMLEPGANSLVVVGGNGSTLTVSFPVPYL